MLDTLDNDKPVTILVGDMIVAQDEMPADIQIAKVSKLLPVERDPVQLRISQSLSRKFHITNKLNTDSYIPVNILGPKWQLFAKWPYFYVF